MSAYCLLNNVQIITNLICSSTHTYPYKEYILQCNVTLEQFCLRLMFISHPPLGSSITVIKSILHLPQAANCVGGLVNL